VDFDGGEARLDLVRGVCEDVMLGERSIVFGESWCNLFHITTTTTATKYTRKSPEQMAKQNKRGLDPRSKPRRTWDQFNGSSR
jgi:hypothetical protein